jgi:hypothetical protein
VEEIKEANKVVQMRIKPKKGTIHSSLNLNNLVKSLRKDYANDSLSFRSEQYPREVPMTSELIYKLRSAVQRTPI